MAARFTRRLVGMAARNVRRNWRHSLGTLLSISVGFMAIGLFEGYLDEIYGNQAAQLARQGMYGDLLVERPGASTAEGREDPWAYHLGPNEQAFLDRYLAAHAAEVKTRVRFLLFSGLASTGKAGAVVLGWGHDVAEGAAMRQDFAWNAVAGKPLQEAGPRSVLLAQGLGRTLDCAAAPGAEPRRPDGRLKPEVRPFTCRRGRVQLTATTERGQLNVVELEVVGLASAGLQEADARMAILPLEEVQRLLDTTDLSRMTVALRGGVDPAAFSRQLQQAAAAEGVALSAMPWTEHPEAEVYRRGLEILGVFRTFMVLVVVSIAAMSVLMTMMKAVAERTREIGTLRSLGFLRRQVVALFSVEAALLAALASAVGLVGTLVVATLVNQAGITYSAGIMAEPVPLRVALTPGAYLFAVGFLSAVAMVAAVLPARQAARLGIPEALAHA